MPYDNRPQYGQQPHYAGHDGQRDFEQAYGNSFAETIPPPARMPSYSNRGGSQPSGYQGHYPLPGTNRHVPPAAHSLAPVAMGSARGVMATGPQISQHNIEAPARPSAKAGMSILFAGAIIGGLIGAVMHARQNAADAFSTAAPTHEVAADATAPTPPSSAPAPTAKDDANSRLVAKDSDKADKAQADGKKKKAGFVWHAPSKGVTTVTHDATIDKDDDTDPTPAPVKKGKPTKGSNKDDDGYTIASADDSSTAKPDTKTSKKTADKTTATATAEAAPPPAKKGTAAPVKGGDDAASVLKAAMGATENSL